MTIVALGDSTTAGAPGWKSPVEAPPDGKGNEQSQYAYWLMQSHPGWRVLNRGVDGERTNQIQRRFARDVVEAAPRVVVIIAGVNDVYQGKPIPQVITNLDQLYGSAKSAGIRVLAGTIIPYNTATAEQNAAMRVINDWIGQAPGRDPNVAVVDTRAAVAAPGDADRLVSSPDGLHPSVDGYHRMADAIGAALETIVR